MIKIKKYTALLLLRMCRDLKVNHTGKIPRFFRLTNLAARACVLVTPGTTLLSLQQLMTSGETSPVLPKRSSKFVWAQSMDHQLDDDAQGALKLRRKKKVMTNCAQSVLRWWLGRTSFVRLFTRGGNSNTRCFRHVFPIDDLRNRCRLDNRNQHAVPNCHLCLSFIDIGPERIRPRSATPPQQKTR